VSTGTASHCSSVDLVWRRVDDVCGARGLVGIVNEIEFGR
jgi:hypothetical protein